MAGEAGMAQRLQKTVQQFLIRLKIHLNDLPAILCLGIDRREMKTDAHAGLYKHVNGSTIPKNQKTEHP